MVGAELCSFSASLNGQIGKARLTTGGVIFIAAGGVHTSVEQRGSDVIKFKVTPEKNPKAILRFELAPPAKPFMLQVCLTEDQRCGMSEAEVRVQERVVLEEVRAHVTNQKHWPCNAPTASSSAAAPSVGSSSSSSKSGTSAATGGGWGRSIAGTAPVGQVSAGSSSRGSSGAPPQAKKRRLQGSQSAASRAAEAAAAERALEDSCKEALLDADPTLQRQYLEAVVQGGVVTEAEFWQSRHVLVAREMASRQGRQEGLEAFWWRKAREGQDLAAAASSSSGGAGRGKSFKMTLKADDVHKIFQLYPAVQQLYAQKVPHEVPADQFWAAFFKSEFLSLGKGASSGSGGASSSSGGGGSATSEGLEGGLFAAIGNANHQAPKRTPLELHALAAATDPSVDLLSAYGDYTTDPTLLDVYEPVAATKLDLPSEADKREAQERTFTINAYNQHGERLLQNGPDPLGRAVKDTQADLASSSSSSTNQHPQKQPPLVLGIESDLLRHARDASVRASATDLPELRAPPPPDTIALPGLEATAHCHTGSHQAEGGEQARNGKEASGASHYAPTMCRAAAPGSATGLQPNTLSGGLVVQPAPPAGTGAAALKAFRQALDATCGASGGGGSGGNRGRDGGSRHRMQPGGGDRAACLVEARKKAQRCHELLRHFYALTTAAQGAWRGAGGGHSDNGAATATPAINFLAPADAAKLSKLEARMEVVADEVRKETRERAEEATGLQQQEHAHVAHAQCLQAMAQLRALEKQFEKAFSTLSGLRGENTGSGKGGFVAVQDSPRRGGR